MRKLLAVGILGSLGVGAVLAGSALAERPSQPTSECQVSAAGRKCTYDYASQSCGGAPSDCTCPPWAY